MTRRAKRLLPLAAFAVFLLLRAWGNGFGPPPVHQHPDERHYAGVARRMSWADLNPHRFENPPLLTYVLFGAAEARAAVLGEADTERWLEDGGLFRLARWIAAILGALTALVVGATAGRLLGSRGAAVAAAVVVGFSYLHARDSHYGVNDVPMVFFVALALHGAARALLGDGRRFLVLSAAAAGAAAATKYNGAIACVLPATAWALLAAERAGPPGPARRRLPRLAGAFLAGGLGLAAVCIAAFLAGNPFAVLGFDEFLGGFRNQLTGWGDHAIWGQAPDPGWLLYGRAMLAMLGVAHALAALAGLALLVRRRPRAALLVGLCPLLYLAGMLSKTLFFWRFALPLLPFAAVAAAAGWTWLAERLAERLARRAAAPALGLLLLVAAIAPAVRIARHDQLLTRTHTWMQAREWILANVPPGDRIFLEGYPPTFPATRRVTLARLRVAGLAAFRETAPDGSERRPVLEGGWLVTDSFYEHGWSLQERGELDAEFRRRLRERFELVAEFAPGPQGDPLPFVLDALYSPLVELWDIERPGFTVRVWRIPPWDWARVFGG